MITGLEQALKALDKIDRTIENKVVKPAVRKALNPIVRAAKANCPWPSVRKLIGKKVLRTKKPHKITGKVFLRRSKNRTIKLDGREVGFEALGNILEFGSAATHNPPRPFMRPASHQAAAQAEAIMAAEIKKGLEKL